VTDTIVFRFSVLHRSSLPLTGVGSSSPVLVTKRRPFYVGTESIMLRRPFNVSPAPLSLSRHRPFFVWGVNTITLQRPFDLGEVGMRWDLTRPFHVIQAWNVTYPAPTRWKPSTFYPAHSIVTGSILLTEVGGTSGLTPPATPAVGDTVTDGTITWIALGALPAPTVAPPEYGVYDTAGWHPGISISGALGSGSITVFSDDKPRTRMLNQIGTWGFSVPQKILDTATGQLISNPEVACLHEDALVRVSNSIGGQYWMGTIDRLTWSDGKVTVECSDILSTLAQVQLKDFPPEPDPLLLAKYGESIRQVIWNVSAEEFLKKAFANIKRGTLLVKLDIDAKTTYFGQLAFSGDLLSVLNQVASHAFIEYTYNESGALVVRDKFVGEAGGQLTDGEDGVIVAGPSYLRDVSPVVNALTVKGTSYQLPAGQGTGAGAYMPFYNGKPWGMTPEQYAAQQPTQTHTGQPQLTAVEYQPIANVTYPTNGLRVRWQEQTLDSKVPRIREQQTNPDTPVEAVETPIDTAALLRAKYFDNFIKAVHDMWGKAWQDPDAGPPVDGAVGIDWACHDELDHWTPHRTLMSGGGIDFGQIKGGENVGKYLYSFYNNKTGEMETDMSWVVPGDAMATAEKTPYEKALYESYNPTSDGIGQQVMCQYVDGLTVKSGLKWVITPYPNYGSDVTCKLTYGIENCPPAPPIDIIYVNTPGSLPPAPFFCTALTEMFECIGYNVYGGLIVYRAQGGTSAIQHRAGEDLIWHAPVAPKDDPTNPSLDPKDDPTYTRRMEIGFKEGEEWGKMYLDRVNAAARTLNLHIINSGDLWSSITIGSTHNVVIETEGIFATARVIGVAPAEYSGTMEINVEVLSASPGSALQPGHAIAVESIPADREVV
jgi:hypothetical protein